MNRAKNIAITLISFTLAQFILYKLFLTKEAYEFFQRKKNGSVCILLYYLHNHQSQKQVFSLFFQ